MQTEQVIIERKEGVTTYGKIVGSGGKLGQYTVYSDILGDDGEVYMKYSDAQKKMAKLIGFHNEESKRR